jgi:hypothetical protein
MLMPDLDAERRAFQLLQWVPFSLPTSFDQDLAAQGHYTALQKQRSDQALAAWDKQHPHETSDELAAFKELEWLGIYSQADLFSPIKAKDGFYSRRLRSVSNHRPRRPSAAAQPHRSTRRAHRLYRKGL